MTTYSEVVDAGPGWTKVKDANGNILTVQGTRNWRNNNPGNLEYGPFAKSQGAIGTDGRFAVFPDYNSGRTAKEQLLFESPNYRNLSLSDAISRYAPPSENNTSAYLNAIARAAGVSPDTIVSNISPAQRASILDAIQKVEGWKPGTINGAAALDAIESAAPGGWSLSGLVNGALGGVGNAYTAAAGALGAGGQQAGRAMQGAGQQLAPALAASMLGSLSGRTAIMRYLMNQNIGRAPVMVPGSHPGGSQVMAVNKNGATAATLMRPATGAGGQSSQAFDQQYHSGQNMDVYRANRAEIGGPITQQSINRALASGSTLFRSA